MQVLGPVASSSEKKTIVITVFFLPRDWTFAKECCFYFITTSLWRTSVDHIYNYIQSKLKIFLLFENLTIKHKKIHW